MTVVMSIICLFPQVQVFLASLSTSVDRLTRLNVAHICEAYSSSEIYHIPLSITVSDAKIVSQKTRLNMKTLIDMVICTWYTYNRNSRCT